MSEFEHFIFSISDSSIAILDKSISTQNYIPLDLSIENNDLRELDITDPEVCQSYIDTVLGGREGHIAYGGYLEVRNLYGDKSGFNKDNEAPRNIHLGIDYWAPAGTDVITPLDGKIHSFKNNHIMGDYGPTIVLEHYISGISFFTLYGHLSLESINGLVLGKEFRAGSTLGTLGTSEVNVNYAPHLHFQIIKDLEGNSGDYPGVCAINRLDFYRHNCPNPNLLLKI